MAGNSVKTMVMNEDGTVNVLYFGRVIGVASPVKVPGASKWRALSNISNSIRHFRTLEGARDWLIEESNA